MVALDGGSGDNRSRIDPPTHASTHACMHVRVYDVPGRSPRCRAPSPRAKSPANSCSPRVCVVRWSVGCGVWVCVYIYIYIDVGVYMEWVAVPTGSFNPPTHPPTDHAPTHPSIYPQIHPHTNVRGVGRLGVPLDGLARLVQEGHLAGALFFGRRGGDIG